MLNKLKKSDNKGFTIIEVMIVLAIAGLIILIVLLAVPALQRNGRNTAIKNDASALTAAVAEYASNNDGNIADAGNSSQAGATVTVNGLVGGSAANKATAKVQGSTTVTFSDGASSQTPASGNIYVEYKAKCPASVSGTSVLPVGANRSTAVIYSIELSGANAVKCIDS